MRYLVGLVAVVLMAAPDRASIIATEKMLDRRIETMFDEPFLLLGMTRGVYLEGTGAIFTAEVSLAISPAGPFAPKMDQQEMARIRKKRQERLPVLRTSMEEFLLRSAAMLPRVPDEERIVVGVTIFRKSAEDNTGIPAQIVMQATKHDLMAKNKSAIRVQEF